jgi:hypothetical protein
MKWFWQCFWMIPAGALITYLFNTDIPTTTALGDCLTRARHASATDTCRDIQNQPDFYGLGRSGVKAATQ